MNFMTYTCRLLLLSLMLLSPLPGQSQGIAAGNIYSNSDVGMRVVFSNQWQVYTSRENAPDILKANFPADKGPNDSPLLVALDGDQQVSARVLVQVWFDDLQAYAEQLADGFRSQGLELLSARMTADESVLQLEYLHPGLGLRFRERIALLQGSQAIRLALWSSAAEYDNRQSEMEAVFAAAELHDVINAEPGWQPVFARVETRLDNSDITGISLSQNQSASLSALQCDNPESSMLWHVAGQGGDVYLFGSIHVGRPDFYPLHATITEAFAEAEHLVFEVDPESANDPSLLLQMQTQGMLPPGQTLRDVVSAEVVTELEAVLSDLGLPSNQFMTMRPWLLTLVLSTFQMGMLGYQPEYGIENYLASQRTPQMDILELESIQEQIGFLQELNAESFLAYTLESFEQGPEDIETMMTAWRCADKAGLEAFLFEEFESSVTAQGDMETLRETMFYQRNQTMAAGIREFIDNGEGDFFVVVGSGHLLGERSIIDLLQNQGYRVTPVSLQ